MSDLEGGALPIEPIIDHCIENLTLDITSKLDIDARQQDRLHFELDRLRRNLIDLLSGTEPARSRRRALWVSPEYLYSRSLGFSALPYAKLESAYMRAFLESRTADRGGSLRDAFIGCFAAISLVLFLSSWAPAVFKAFMERATTYLSPIESFGPYLLGSYIFAAIAAVGTSYIIREAWLLPEREFVRKLCLLTAAAILMLEFTIVFGWPFP